MSGLDGSSWRAATAAFVSFDGSTKVVSSYYQPDRYRFWEPESGASPAISRGAGLSYAAASFGANNPSLDHRHFGRLIDFDSRTNVLAVEAGATLGDIHRFAAPRRLMLKIQPGHPSITIGGCIAADVHGKNQLRDGTFREQVEAIRLFHPTHGMLDLSPSENPELFHLTCGGYGLTGNILQVHLRLSPAPSPHMKLSVTPIEDISRLEDEFSAAAQRSDLIYSWHNFTARGNGFGSGHLICGSFAADGPPVTAERKSKPLDSATRGLPFRFFNSWTTPVFNRLYAASVRRGAPEKSIPLYEALFPIPDKQLYFHLFGKRGFHESQIVVPPSRFPGFAEAIQQRLHRDPVPVTLASAKLFGGKRELLRFTGEGICLSLNFPRGENGNRFAAFLDEAMREHGGWPNIIKDSRLSANVVSAAYPEYERFRMQLRNFDPQRLYRSELSERLAL